MMDVLFFTALALYFAAVLLHFGGMVFKKAAVTRAAWWLFVAGTVCNTAYLAVRGIVAERLPLANQFEFATAFAWGIAVMLIVLHTRFRADWICAAGMPMAFLMLSYAALQPKEITELMPALRSAWFGLHIGCAVFAYASFLLAGCAGLRYVLLAKKSGSENVPQNRLKQMDYLGYRLIALGFLLLTVVILSGAIWAEQAWSAFWSWDPKETWALITWIVYAIYLHQRLVRKRSGAAMAWFAMIAVLMVLFTFIGVNTLLPGLHSYG